MDQGEENTNTHTGVEFLFLDPSVVFFFFFLKTIPPNEMCRLQKAIPPAKAEEDGVGARLRTLPGNVL